MTKYVDDLLEEKLKKIKEGKNLYNTGNVIRIEEYIVEVGGLEDVSFFEEVMISDKARGYVSSILLNSVIVSIVKEDSPIFINDLVHATGEVFTAYYSDDAMGRIIDIFGEDITTGGKFESSYKLTIENDSLPIMKRGTVNRALLTGIAGIDLVYPIGKGQRQLIIGDKKSGKTQICLDTIANQKDKDVICIYVAIGKTKNDLKSIYNELFNKGALNYTLIVAALNSEKTTVLTVTPYAALAIAEKYMHEGKDVLVVIDDLKRHAEAHREMSLIIGKTPGRDAYPADIFYAHSRLLEKGAQHIDKGSITILPVVETVGGDITGYIPTNIISITDGQIVLSSSNFQKGIKPAIDYGLSVSRLGGAVQDQELKELGPLVRRKLLSYLETKDIYELANIDEMSEELKRKLKSGKKIQDALIQYKYSPLSKKDIINTFKFLEEKNHES